MILYTYPNLGLLTPEDEPPRGNIDSRKIRVDHINRERDTSDFQIVEIPADCIKTPKEANKTKLPPCSFLDEKSVPKLYTKSSVKYEYILHTEPEISRKFPKVLGVKPIATLKWSDDDWIDKFIGHTFSIIDFFDQLPYALEIHPGKKKNGNNPNTFSNAIKEIYDRFFRKYNKEPRILIENRTGSFIKTGEEISSFWTNFTNRYPEMVNNVGIILDIKQFFTCCKSDFRDQLEKVPLDCIKGFHIHSGKRGHRAPKLGDGINWELVFQKIKTVEEGRRILLLLEVHHEQDVFASYDFCKKFLKI